MNLREWMKTNRWTGAAFASAMSVSLQHIYNIRDGGTMPSDRLARSIVDFTNGEVTYESLRPPKSLPKVCPCCGQRLFKSNLGVLEKVETQV
jgi:hypothetical protein